MVKITDDYLKQSDEFKKYGIQVPTYSQTKMVNESLVHPTWIHFGGGNLFRAFHAAIAHKLLQTKAATTGVIMVETYDDEVVKRAYQDYNNRILRIITEADGSQKRDLLASVAAAWFVGKSSDKCYQDLENAFKQPSLQVVSFSITEKGYKLTNRQGQFKPDLEHDFKSGPFATTNNMTLLTGMLYARYQNGAYPIALLSTDNFSQNGDVLKHSVLTIAKKWLANQLVSQAFIDDYLANDQKVAFPCSMIDRITPNPSSAVQRTLESDQITGVDVIHTTKHTNIAAFANTEAAHYLVIEDHFPNGRPAWEKAGVILTSREIVNDTDEMKVTTCLNPLHTALAIFGSLLGFTSISEEMKDSDLLGLIQQIGYVEGLPVVKDPKVINPKKFLDELITKRLPNPYIPDTPQRIATDTSQKLAVRYGITIRHYLQLSRPNFGPASLTFIPLVIAAWLRYLTQIDDAGQVLELSPDPLLDQLIKQMENVHFGATDTLVHERVSPILSDERIFGINLYDAGLGDIIECDLVNLLKGPQAVRSTLHQMLKVKATPIKA
ncbi:mannitol dehydrogenase family protein [Secundilactobacillus mixtipabuli]|uniref:mannitol dehydrogenase family protein n=1 Tax=Secundilactobacillus mixtipabuli TaxID=1435342 RepID=UPI000B5CE43F|nr:mannitol dehydrogenase family protein [Secundilactobacillus mixtipabuli]